MSCVDSIIVQPCITHSIDFFFNTESVMKVPFDKIGRIRSHRDRRYDLRVRWFGATMGASASLAAASMHPIKIRPEQASCCDACAARRLIRRHFKPKSDRLSALVPQSQRADPRSSCRKRRPGPRTMQLGAHPASSRVVLALGSIADRLLSCSSRCGITSAMSRSDSRFAGRRRQVGERRADAPRRLGRAPMPPPPPTRRAPARPPPTATMC